MRSVSFSARAVPALFVLAAACSGNSVAPENEAPMTQVEAEAAADVVVNDLVDQTEGATSTSTGTSFLASIEEPMPSMVRALWWSACTPAPTRTVDGSTVTYVYTNCVAERPFPLERVTRNGQVAITAEAGLRRLTFTNFTNAWERISFRTRERVTFTEAKTGTQQVTQDNGTTLSRLIYGATQADGFRTTFTADDGATGTHLRRWTSVFTADVAQSVTRNAPLPAGTFAISGSSEWTRTREAASRSWSFAVQTGADGVHYNPDCEAAGPNFDSGTITIVATNRAGATTTVVVTFTGCGVWTVARS